MDGPGFLGTQATMLRDVTLLIEIVFYLVLCAGVAAQLKGQFQWHDRLQTPVVLLNLLFIGLVMLPAFSGGQDGVNALGDLWQLTLQP